MAAVISWYVCLSQAKAFPKWPLEAQSRRYIRPMLASPCDVELNENRDRWGHLVEGVLTKWKSPKGITIAK